MTPDVYLSEKNTRSMPFKKIIYSINGLNMASLLYLANFFNSTVSLLLLILFAVLSCFTPKKTRFCFDNFLLFFGLSSIFVLLYFISASLSLDVGFRILYMLLNFLVFFIATLANPEAMKETLKNFTFFAILINFISFSVYILNLFSSSESLTRFSGFGSNPNSYSMSLLVLFSVVYALNKSKDKIIFNIYFVFCLVFLVFTFSRGAYFSVAVLFLYCFMFDHQNKLRGKKRTSQLLGKVFLILILMFGVYVSGIGAIVTEAIYDRMSRLGSSETNIRWIFWENAINVYISADYSNQLFGGLYELLPRDVHNSYLRTLLEHGAIWFLVFFGFLATCFFSLRESDLVSCFSKYSLLIFIIYSMANDVYSHKASWIALGISVGCLLISRKDRLNY